MSRASYADRGWFRGEKRRMPSKHAKQRAAARNRGEPVYRRSNLEDVKQRRIDGILHLCCVDCDGVLMTPAVVASALPWGELCRCDEDNGRGEP